MRYEQALELLDDYVDGTLPQHARTEFDSLLASSSPLREQLQLAQQLRDATGTLPRSITPARDLWSAIASHIESSKVVSHRFEPEPAAARTHSPWQRWGLLAAAAMVLIGVSSGITAYLIREPATPTPAAPSSDQPHFSAVVWEQFRDAEQKYQQVTDELLAAMEQRRDELDPETIRVVEDNMRLIDRAIAESRTALEKDPSNGHLANKLSDIYRKRVDFLLQMNRL